MQPEVLCRSLIIAHTLQTWGVSSGGRKTYQKAASYLWRVHYNAYIGQDDLARLRVTCRALADDLSAILSLPVPSGAEGCPSLTAPIPLASLPCYRLDRGTCTQLLPVLSLWADCEPVPFMQRCARNRLDLHIRCMGRGMGDTGASSHVPIVSTKGMKALTAQARQVCRQKMEHTGAIVFMRDTLERQLDYMVYGSYSGAAPSTAVANPTMYRACDYRVCLSDPCAIPQWTAHYGTQPTTGYEISSKAAGYRSDLECESVFGQWMRAFDRAMSSRRVTVTLLGGDCLPILMERCLSPRMHGYADTHTDTATDHKGETQAEDAPPLPLPLPLPLCV
ncbi:hypothetical protein KIPB_003478 [Kipferlia bialata]|uniref:Uncharacterized protein n=1 Tax=Kipferlia bialata TaxID=797122 RepID=A0A9K3CU47_9EUKA|nr:hypothetical protein KIPB_003478 [Kipferlia bialata]|eukprot:g3478.t1